jgi:hypothetical protein
MAGFEPPAVTRSRVIFKLLRSLPLIGEEAWVERCCVLCWRRLITGEQGTCFSRFERITREP